MDDFLFQDEPPHQEAERSPGKDAVHNEEKFWKILIVDDDEEVHAVTRFALNDIQFKERSLQFLSAYSAKEATELIAHHSDTALILLDVVMEEDHSGLDLVHHIRKNLQNQAVRIILRTGQSGLSPERDVIVQYDINDYKEKSELTAQKLFTSVIASLRSYNDLLQIEEQTKQHERVTEEFRVAQSIQREMMPNNFPLFPDRKEFELYAQMESAFEVGGDFYDMFFLNNQQLCFFIGDVSGKGLGAALFMVQCKTILKREAHHSNKPSEILERANRFLYNMNKGYLEHYFATMLLGIYDLEKEEISFGNAGHNPPIISRPDEKIGYVDLPGSYPLSMFADTHYPSCKMSFKKGSSLLLYTDGITEAFNSEKEQFGSERLLDHAVHSLGKMSCKTISSSLFQKLCCFRDGAEQSDDISLLTLITDASLIAKGKA